jgi:hypothetical protein
MRPLLEAQLMRTLAKMGITELRSFDGNQRHIVFTGLTESYGPLYIGLYTIRFRFVASREQ